MVSAQKKNNTFSKFLAPPHKATIMGHMFEERDKHVHYLFIAGLPRAKRAWDRAPYSWNIVNLYSFGCDVIDRAYASTDCTGGVGETIKRKGGVSQAWFLQVLIFYIGHCQYGQLTAVKTG